MNFFLHTGNSFSSDSVYNTATRFIVEIPKNLDLQGEWVVGISEVIFKNHSINTSVGYICSDFIENSIFGDKSLPCFRSICIPNNNHFTHLIFENVFYFKVTSNFIQNLNIWMLNDCNEMITSTSEDLMYLTFHFKRLNLKC